MATWDEVNDLMVIVSEKFDRLIAQTEGGTGGSTPGGSTGGTPGGSTPPPADTSLAAPQNVVATVLPNRVVKLDWDSADGVTWEVHEFLINPDSTLKATVSVPTRTSSSLSGGNYQYAVRARNSSGELSPFSRRVNLLIGADVASSTVEYESAPATDPNSTVNPTVSARQFPAEAINLRPWKIQLPVRVNDSVKEVKQPTLATYADKYFSLTDDKTGIRYRVWHGGETTDNSSNPRSELREMSANGAEEVQWSTTSGTHTFEVTLSVNRLTAVRPHVVLMQIHDKGTRDITMFRLEGSNLYITTDGNSHAHLVTSSFKLNTKVKLKMQATGGKVYYWYNGVKSTFVLSASESAVYFKAGNYLQSNPDSAPGESITEYSEVVHYAHALTHSGTGGAPTDGSNPPVGTVDTATAAGNFNWGAPLASSDEFAYTGVPNSTKWSVYNGPGHSGNGVRSPNRVTVKDGKMIITGLAGDANTAGVSHKEKRQYGRWEIRARTFYGTDPATSAPGNRDGGYHPVAIIWPDSGEWPEDGEYDFMENGEPGEQEAGAFIHYPHDSGISVQQIDMGSQYPLAKDLRQWHHFAIEWTSAGIQLFVDGVKWGPLLSGGATSSRRAIQTMPSGHLTLQLDAFQKTGLLASTMEIDWIRVYSHTSSGSSYTPGTVTQPPPPAPTRGVGGVPAPLNAIKTTADSTAALKITSGGTATAPKVYDGGGHTVGPISISAPYVVVQNFRIVANAQYGAYIDADNVTFQNNDIKGVKVSGDGDLNAITFFGSNVKILNNTAENFVTGDPGGSHTDFIQTWISSSHPKPSNNVQIRGNKATGPANPGRDNGIASIHQAIMAEGYGRGGNSGGDGADSSGWTIADNEFGDSWNQAIKLDGVDNVNITRNNFTGSSTKVLDITAASSNVKFFSDNVVGAGYGSVGYSVTSGAGPA